MDRAGARCGVAKSDLASELGVRRRHEGRHLFMANLDVLHPVLCALQGHIKATDAISGISINPAQTPFRQTLPNEFADIHVRYPEL